MREAFGDGYGAVRSQIWHWHSDQDESRWSPAAAEIVESVDLSGLFFQKKGRSWYARVNV